MSGDSVMRNLGLLNVLWDGGSHSVGRRTSESFTVKGARLTVALQIQELTLRSFFDKSGGLARGTGFLARFLVAWPESTQGYRPFTEAPPNWPHLAAFHQRIAAILANPVPIDEEGALSPALMMLAPEAKAAWVAFHDAIEAELKTGGELYDVRDVASKSADNAARLTALFQIFELMAWFNAPLPQPDHTLRAIKSALAIREAVTVLHSRLPEEAHLDFGVGIHSGEAVLGWIGTEKRLEYTAIGNSVNTAKRLQENAAKNQILITGEAYARVKDQVDARPFIPLLVKGKTQRVEAFEVLGLRRGE